MKNAIFISIRVLLLMTLLTGIIYPLVITGVAQLLLNNKASGSLIKVDGNVIGSSLIGQQFSNPAYFTSRPSAVNYQAVPSGASNFSWTDKRMKEDINHRKANFVSENMLDDTTEIPLEMLFASASGLDPHISPEAAKLQVNRISLVRNLTEDQRDELIQIIENLTEKPQYALFGNERINVFLLNIELDKIR